MREISLSESLLILFLIVAVFYVGHRAAAGTLFGILSFRGRP